MSSLWFKGHDDWVYSVCWCLNHSHGTNQSDCNQCMPLLSSSMDKTLILWKPDPLSGVWMEEVNIKLVCTYLCVCLLNLQQLRVHTACVIKLLQKKNAVAMAAQLKCRLPFSQTQLTVFSLHLHNTQFIYSNCCLLLFYPTHFILWRCFAMDCTHFSPLSLVACHNCSKLIMEN